MNDPIDNIKWIDRESLTANLYNPNVVFNKELKLLELSILKNGWIQPILVNVNNIIIDGFHRWKLSGESKLLKEKYKYLAGKEGVSISDTKNTKWFTIDDQGCAGLLYTSKYCRIKGVYILKEFRGIGTGTKLTDYLISIADRPIEVLAYNKDFYIAKGFDLVKEYRKGVYILRKYG